MDLKSIILKKLASSYDFQKRKAKSESDWIECQVPECPRLRPCLSRLGDDTATAKFPRQLQLCLLMQKMNSWVVNKIGGQISVQRKSFLLFISPLNWMKRAAGILQCFPDLVKSELIFHYMDIQE